MTRHRLALALLTVVAVVLGACTASQTGGSAQPSTQAPTPDIGPMSGMASGEGAGAARRDNAEELTCPPGPPEAIRPQGVGDN